MGQQKPTLLYHQSDDYMYSLSRRVYDAFGFALDQGHHAIFKRLYEYAKDVERVTERLYHLNRVVQKEKGWTLLHIACRGGHEEVAKISRPHSQCGCLSRGFRG